MALVKKYQNAAGPLPEGKFTMNGKHLLGQQALERIAAAYELDKNGPKDMYSIATRAIKDGNEAIYDPTENTIQILDSTGKDITSNYVGKGITASINDSTLKRNLGATFNTKNHRFKQSGLLLADVDMDTRKELRRGSGWFDTNNEAYDVNSILNKDREDLIKSLLNYAVDTNNVDDIYKYSNWNNADRTQLRNLGNELLAYKGGVEGYSTDFINRLHSGNLSEGDINLLKLMGFEKPVPPVVETPIEEASSSSAAEETADKDGETPEAEQDNDDSETEGVVRGADGRYYLNGDAYKDSVWYLGGFDNFANTDYENGFAINGTVYSLDEVLKDRSFDPYVAKFITAGRTAKDWNSWYDAANASGVRFLDDRLWAQEHNGIEDTSTYYGGYQNYNSDVYSPMYYDYFTNAKILGGGVKDLTPWFKDAKGYNIISYVSPNNENQAGVMTPQYLVYLGNGEYSDPYSDLNTLAKDYELEVDPYNKYIQTALPLNAWNNGFAEHARFKTADGTQENTIVRDKNGTWYLQYNNTTREIPKENLDAVYALLERDADFYNTQIEALTKSVRSTSKRANEYARRYAGLAHSVSPSLSRKYQIGGALTSSSHINGTTLGKYEEPKTPRKHDVTKAHNLDGSNGGLTQAERLQIMGAIADLGGVVSSFAGPVGGAIGAGAGLTGTGLRFMGDLKQGEKSTWEAVKDLAINTAFDIAALPASLVPGLDNAIKASKFVRVVKGIGTPILKYMGTIGLSSALINTASKIINGEKYTSEDLINLANGLSGGIVAGKQWSKQLGDARLAAKASGKAAEAANANLRGEFNTRIGNQNLTLKNEDIANIVTEAKGNRALVINKLISKANEAGITMTEDQAAKALADFNISAKKQNLFAKIFKKSKVEFKEPTPQEGNSTAHYFFHSNLRNRALGNYRPNDKQANVVKSLTEEDYDNALFENGVPVNGTPKRTKDYTWEGALRRLGAQNPGALGFRTAENTEQFVMPWQFGRRANIRLPMYRTGGLLGEVIRANISPVLDLSSALLQNRDISRSYDYLHDANAERKKRQFIAPQVQLPTFNSSSIEQKYNAAKNPLLNTKLTYNDSMLNLAGKLALSEQMSNLEAQKGTELSDYTSRYNDARLNALNQISQINANVANEQSAYITNVNALDEQLKANELNEKWSSIWNTYSQQVRQDLRTKHDTVKGYNLDNQISELQEEQSLAKKNALSSLYEQYDASGSTLMFEDWMTRTPSAYKKYLEIQEGEKWKDMIQKQHKAYNDVLIKNIYAKQGTKLTEREKLVIQGDKAAKEAVKNMNKNLTQLLLKLMK